MGTVSCWWSVTGCLALVVALLLLLWYWNASKIFNLFEKLGIKGPKASLFNSGNMNVILKKGFIESFIDWEKEYGKIYGVFRSRRPSLVITDPDLLREVMAKRFVDWPNRLVLYVLVLRVPRANTTDLVNFKPWSETVSSLKDDHWKHVRSQLSPLFSSGKIKKMLPVLKQCCKELVENVQEKAARNEEVDARLLTNAFSMDVIAGTVFGMQVNSLRNPEEKIVQVMNRLIYPSKWTLYILYMFPWLSSFLFRLGVAIFSPDATNYLLAVVESALKQRRQGNMEYHDMLQLMVESERKDFNSQQEVDPELDHSNQLRTSSDWTRKGLTEEEIQGNCLLFLLAGFDSMSSAISFLLYNLAAHPHILKKAQEEIDQKIGENEVDYRAYSDLPYLDMCMNESLRLYPPGIILDRESSEEITFAGMQFPKKMVISIPVYSIHTNPEFWPDPMKFDPERHTPEAKAARNPFTFLPFGQGPRNCIGMRLGQLELKMAVASILQKFSPVLCNKSVYPPKLSKAVRLGSEDTLWIKFQIRK